MKRSILSALAMMVASVLSACGAPHLRQVEAAKSALIGRTPTDVRECIGEPLSRSETDRGEVWRYSSAQRRGTADRLLAPRLGDRGEHSRACVFTVRFSDGRVTSVSSDNRAGWGFGSIKNCSAVIRHCI